MPDPNVTPLLLDGPVCHLHDGPAEGLAVAIARSVSEVYVPGDNPPAVHVYQRADGVCSHGRPVFGFVRTDLDDRWETVRG